MIQLYRLYTCREGGKPNGDCRKKVQKDQGLVEIIFGGGGNAFRVWLQEPPPSEATAYALPPEKWLFHPSTTILTDGRIYVWGTEFLDDGHTEVVQEWYLSPEGTKEEPPGDELGE